MKKVNSFHQNFSLKKVFESSHNVFGKSKRPYILYVQLKFFILYSVEMSEVATYTFLSLRMGTNSMMVNGHCKY